MKNDMIPFAAFVFVAVWGAIHVEEVNTPMYLLYLTATFGLFTSLK